jgi:prevent-host-death family protein
LKTVSLQQLRRETGSVLALVEQGETIEITRRGRTIALISPPPPASTSTFKARPDFTARLKRVFGGLIVPGDVVVEERQTHRS